MRIECGEADIYPGREHIVDQQPHSHTAIGGLQQRTDKEQADVVVGDEVVLGVEAALRPFGEQQPGGQGIDVGIVEVAKHGAN